MQPSTYLTLSDEVQTALPDQSPVFFLSSRRRHTRSLRDWSSDVCSSDLIDPQNDFLHGEGWYAQQGIDEIGRASCRERVEIWVVAVSLKKKKRKTWRR